jgi:hypothetical protein
LGANVVLVEGDRMGGGLFLITAAYLQKPCWLQQIPAKQVNQSDKFGIKGKNSRFRLRWGLTHCKEKKSKASGFIKKYIMLEWSTTHASTHNAST